MTFRFENLDETTRNLMSNEVEFDIKNNKLYLSSRLSEFGKKHYLQLLQDAIHSGNEATFANNLKVQNCLNTTESRNTKNGIQIVSVPITANETLAEGEFNRFYIRALCRRVIEDSSGVLEVYRAKQVVNPRPESQMKIGQKMDSRKLLNDLRLNTGFEPLLGLPTPNSGLSIKIVK